MSNYYDSVTVNGLPHYVSAISYDDSGNNNIAKVIMASFYTKQQHDQFLASIQKGISFHYDSRRIFTSTKVYVSNLKKCNDDNKGDGYHAMIYAEEENTIIVQKGEDASEKIFNYLKKYKVGLIKEWKDYFINTLMACDCIYKCKQKDLTGGYLPTVYVCRDITTDLIRSFKAEGLLNKKISLPNCNYKALDPTMEYIDIIEQLIIPYIKSEKCYFNLGDKISDVIKSVIKKGNKVINLFPRQQIIAQGALNYISAGNKSLLFNGGTGIGKTYTTIKLVLAIIKEYYKKKDAYIGVYCQSHLINSTWINGFKECFYPLGIYPKIHVINNYKDVRRLNKKPSGLEIIIMPKDRVKKSFMQDHSAIKRFTPTSDVYKFVKSIGCSKSVIEFKKCNLLKKNKLKVAVAKYTREYNKPILLYREGKDKNGKKIFECITNSKTLKKIFGDVHKYYNFSVYNITDVKNAIIKYSSDIEKEKFRYSVKYEKETLDYMICPCCGGKIYENSKFVFSDEHSKKFMKKPYDKSKNNRLAKCNNFVKADGSSLTQEEIQMLISKGNYIITKTKSKIVYVDVDDNPLTETDLHLAKTKLEGDFKIRIRKCNNNMFGYVDIDNGKRKFKPTFNAAKYIRKLFGDNFLDVCIYDESHEYNNMSEQGITMGYLCLASKINILLSGTITGGKSSDLYYTFWRIMPEKMKALGYEFKDEGIFVDHYGRRKRISKETEDYSTSKSGQAKMVSRGWTEIAGISPLLYNNFLVQIMMSRKIEDMGIPLPPIKYIKEEVEMDEELKAGYDNLKNSLVSFMRANPKISLGGTYVKRLKSYPDYPQHGDIYATDKDGNKVFVTTPKKIDINNIHLPKEKKLISTLMKEINQGRKVIVYTEFTGMGVSARLFSLLDKYFNVRELRTDTCHIEKREETVEQWSQDGVDVIICNPELVKTGLNLVSYPTMYFYDQTYKIETLRQAEMRAYRPLQTKECRVYYAFYKDSIQEDAIKLIGTKKRASLALEGVFSNDMLSAMGDGGDTIEAMLNKVLDGKITLKESDLDAFQFETVDYTVVEEQVNTDKVIDVVPIPVNKNKVDNNAPKKANNTMFELDKDFLNKLNKLKEQSNKSTVSNVSNDFMSKLNRLRGIEENKEVAATSSEQISLFD